MSVVSTFKQACGMLKIRVEDPVMIDLDREDNASELEQKILNYMMSSPDAGFRHPRMVVCLLDRENNYRVVKEVCSIYQIPSQVITARNARSFNMSKASNILR